MSDCSRALDMHVYYKKEAKVRAFDKRIALIDFLRGAFMILVLFDHFMYDMRDFLPQFFEVFNVTDGWFYDFAHRYLIDYYIYEGKAVVDNPYLYFTSELRFQVREISLMMFVLLSGISSAFSKDNSKRAIKMVSFWLALAFITNLGNALSHRYELGFQFLINFNVIGVIGLSVMLYCLLEKKSNLFLMNLIFGYLFISFLFFQVPALAEFKDYLKHEAPFLFYPFMNPDKVEINGVGYYQADYMPLIPYVLFFFLGVIISRIVYAVPKDHIVHNKEWMRPLSFVGRHSLVIYITHQILFYAILITLLEIMRAIL